MRRLQGKHARNVLLIRQGGKCALCGNDLKAGWHADHVIPWSVVKETSLHGMQALCPSCNIKKGTWMLRSHQQELLDLLPAEVAGMRRRKQLVASVYPGGGKSLLPIIAAASMFRNGLIKKVCIVVPRLNLRRQIAEEFLKPKFRELLKHNLTVMEATNEVDPAKGTNGWVTTYSAVSCDAALSRTNLHAVKKEPTLLFLDEVHHVIEDSAFHKAIEPLYNAATFRILVTGSLDTPNGDRVAFLDYSQKDIEGKYVPDVDITYGLTDAIRDQAILPIEFHHVDAKVNYIDSGGQNVAVQTLTMGERSDIRKGIYTALRTEYADELLGKCAANFLEHRKSKPRSQMIAICSNIKQAESVVEKLKGMGVVAVLATSEEDDPQGVIQSFRGNVNPPECLVTVMMAYEGLDAPRVTHLVCLTHIRSWPWLMQALNRATRVDYGAGPYREQVARVYCMDDGLMREAIAIIESGQIVGVKELLEVEQDGNSAGGSKAQPAETSQDSDQSSIVPLNGVATHHRVSGMGVEGECTHQETEYLQDLMSQTGLSGGVLAFSQALRIMGVDVSSIAATRQSEENDVRPLTPKEEEEKLRSAINSMMNRLDAKFGCEHGWHNRKCLAEVQNYKPRARLSKNELLRVWVWVNDLARKSGLEVSQQWNV